MPKIQFTLCLQKFGTIFGTQSISVFCVFLYLYCLKPTETDNENNKRTKGYDCTFSLSEKEVTCILQFGCVRLPNANNYEAARNE